MTALVIAAILAPLAVAAETAILGWRGWTAWSAVASTLVVLSCGIALASGIGARPHLVAGGLLRADGLSVTMLIVIGSVGTLSCWAGVGFINGELAHGQTTPRRARRYGALVGVFLAAMVLAVESNNLGIVWVAIEATTIATAFLVGHTGTRTALEATWKYVIICSMGIAFAFLGTVLLDAAAVHSRAGSGHVLDFDVLLSHAGQLDPSVSRLAAGLLMLGYGAKAGLAPLHTWLADAHSQAPAPVSALMSGVLLSVAFSALLRMKAVLDITLGQTFLRVVLLAVGLLTLLISASLLIAQRDLKRMLAYSSMENMALIAIAAAAGTNLAIAALLLHVLAHGIAKTVLFICAGHLQHTHGSTSIANIGAVLARSQLLGASFGAAILVLVGLPPFAMFASELSIARSLTRAHLGVALAATLALVVVAFAALAVNTGQLLLGPAPAEAPVITVPATTAAVLVVGVLACLALGIAAGPLTGLLHTAAGALLAGS